MKYRKAIRAVALASTPLALLLAPTLSGQGTSKRAMTFLDMRLMRSAQQPAFSPDGKWVLYALSVPNWKDARSYTDIYIVSTDRGVESTRQLTFTKDKNEGGPRWSRDGSFFVFASNREAPGGGSVNQLYKMRPDGGEAQRITDAKDGVGSYVFSPDGKYLIFSAGKTDEQQIWLLPVAGIDTAQAVQGTRHQTPIRSWQLSRDGKHLFFLAPDSIDRDDKARLEKKFDVRVRNQLSPAQHLWIVDSTHRERRLTSDTSYSVEQFSVSNDGRWAAFRALPNDRYVRGTTEGNTFGDIYLVNTASGAIERLTTNKEIGESVPTFSPDGSMMAFSAPNEFTYFRLNKLYVRPTTAAGTPWRKLGDGFDGDITVGFWSDNGRTVYFNEGVRATNQFFSIDIASGAVTQLTREKASLGVSRDDDSDRLLITYQDPHTPTVQFTVNSVGDVPNRAAWRQLTNPNPQVASFLLGDAEEISWKSADGKTVGGVLLKPVGYQAGKRYPLIVAIHGGPAGADLLGFNGGYGSQIYAGDGYAVLMPNYRGSTNYGEQHKNDIVGNYFQKGYEDIMTGVDYLIKEGIVDGTKMGALGWSAGGHWSNWILTHTDRFKAISSGAGTSNWISMYAQSDVQRNRQHYLGGKLPYDDFEAYWKQSPIRYIKNARTPTMIHVVDGDPRVPRPQSEELHMALKRLGIPTEFFVYPGSTHGIPDPRNQLVKSVSEKAWMDHWILGKGKFQWQDVLKTLEEKAAATNVSTSSAARPE
jgi:dipeptidyl aminopeptidase/acylaminoacyl peptidase